MSFNTVYMITGANKGTCSNFPALAASRPPTRQLRYFPPPWTTFSPITEIGPSNEEFFLSKWKALDVILPFIWVSLFGNVRDFRGDCHDARPAD